MNAKYSVSVLVRLLCNLLLAYVAYTLCRVVFMLANAPLYQGIGLTRVAELLRAGLVFDSSAIFYTNSLLVLMFLFPLHYKEVDGHYRAARWVFVVVNGLCVALNLCDAVYYPFSGKRVTGSVVQEFGNEGAGMLAGIFVDNALSHWPVVLAGVAIIAMLCLGFVRPRKPRASTVGGLVSYYAAQLCLLVAVGGLSVGLMRGGFTTAVRPITISNANQYADNPSEAAAILNTPFSLIRTFDKTPLVVPRYMPDDEAEAIFSPVKRPAGQGEALCPGFNVVVFIMESFSKQHIGFFNSLHGENGPDGYKETFTPFLDQLLERDALSFRHSYCNGRKSIEGMPPILSSIPNFVEPFFLTPASMNSISGIARELSENKGYASAFFHGAENGSMGFEAFARSSGFQRYFGRSEYCADGKYHGMDDFDGTWAIWDEEFMQFFCDRMGEMQQPFVTSIFTASSHNPYDLPERYKGRFRQGRDDLQEVVMYSDNALRLFFQSASRQPWFGNTIFVITADHTSGNFDPFYATTLGLFSVPIVFYAPGVPQLRGYDDETIVEQTDIMPTLLGLLGYDRPFVSFGQDIFATPRDDKFAIHWIPGWCVYELVKGDYASIFDGESITAVYDYRRDLLLRDNLIATVPQDTVREHERLAKSLIQQYMKRMDEDRLTMKTDARATGAASE